MLSFVKSRVILCLVPLYLWGATFSAQGEEMKIASVDVKKVFDEWIYASEIESQFNGALKALEQANRDRLAVISQYQRKRDQTRQKYWSQADKISAGEKAKLSLKIVTLGRDAVALEQNRRDFHLQAKRSLNREYTAKSKLILDKIAEAVQVYALEAKYDMVVEMGGETTRNLPFFVHLDGSEDITQVIIKRLNAEPSR